MSMPFLRQAASTARSASRSRAFFSTTVVREDIVQSLYVREIKAYKAPPPAKDAHVGSVKAYSLPPAPKPPVLPSDLASELATYDAAEPTKASEPKVTSSSTEQVGTGADGFLSFLEQDEPKAEAHH
ncbi:hypothetical protein SERLA73DRAFT_187746 [Serpula lacrymans var. lacrymans S7.3]|uniref:Uncharacterized protein n=1 Tax=Serpula lacrymans var. lacrymans (strain S7.3) TaxID=936435 RepID=F8QAA0_SERL3|nr:hypothetical protein SERLA73DRAFT_187746 [Serpula lacrymans var. lacrymans S7.3]